MLTRPKLSEPVHTALAISFTCLLRPDPTAFSPRRLVRLDDETLPPVPEPDRPPPGPDRPAPGPDRPPSGRRPGPPVPGPPLARGARPRTPPHPLRPEAWPGEPAGLRCGRASGPL